MPVSPYVFSILRVAIRAVHGYHDEHARGHMSPRADMPVFLAVEETVGFTWVHFSRSLIVAERVYKKIELTGTSDASLEDAIAKAVQHAGQTVRNMRWFEVVETRGRIVDAKVAEWQVTLKIGFALDD